MKKEKQVSPIRLSHLTSYSGVGAVIRNVNDQLMVITDIRYWNDRYGNTTAVLLKHVERIKVVLQISKDLRSPPVAKELPNDQFGEGLIPGVLFPRTAVCRSCGALHNNPWRHIENKGTIDVYCKQCESRHSMQQTTWCVISDEGYLDEVPWHYLCHKGSPNNCCREDYDANYLRLIISDDGRPIVKCNRCGANARYRKAELASVRRIQPWLKDQPNHDKALSARVLEINDPLVYQPINESGLVIPPESRMNADTPQNRLLGATRQLQEINDICRPLLKKGRMKRLATECRCSLEDVEAALNAIDVPAPNEVQFESLTQGQLLDAEYKALLTPLDFKDSEDFVARHKTDEWKRLRCDLDESEQPLVDLVDNLVVVERLREIQVFRGFSRGANGHDDDGSSSSQDIIPPDITGEVDWMPAVELYGEGVFFTIDETWLSDWESRYALKKRAEEFSARYESSLDVPTFYHLEGVTPRFILLHTLAHLIIRELEVTAGYPAASLNERIYVSSSYSEMAGILIYTAVADVAGSLGGIVESCEPKAFLSILSGVFNHAQWCSLDPVCSEHAGQGPSLLNRAACHACALVPDTSCKYKNVFLDRSFIKGSSDDNIPNLLDDVRVFNNG